MRALWLGLGIALLLAACAPSQLVRDGQRVAYEDAARIDLEQARAALEADELERAREILERFERELAYSRRMDEALMLLGEVHERQQRRELAADTWRRLVEQYPRSSQNPRAALRAAWIYRDLGRPEVGRALLERADWARATADERMRIHRLRADLARQVGDYPSAVVALAYARREVVEPETALEMDIELEELIDEHLTDAQLDKLVQDLPRGPVHDRVNLVIARRALSRSDYEAARRALQRLPARLRPRDELERQRLTARAQRGWEPVQDTVGVALPLSGPYAPFGERVLRSIVLGLGLYDDPTARVRVLLRDTAGDPARGAEAVQELVDAGASAIIGPLRSGVALEAAPVAEAGGVPLLTMARRQDAFLGDFVFRVGLSPADEARALVSHFAGRMGMRRFAVLYPDDGYGRDFKNVFWDEVEQFESAIVGVEKYTPDAVDWQRPIRKLVGLHYLAPEQRELLDERDKLLRYPNRNAERLAAPELQDLPPYVDFDALFIPDAAEKVGLILPQLRFFDVQDVVFIGTSEWNDPKLVQIAGRQATGSVFASAFNTTSEHPKVRLFLERHRAAYGDDPDILGALAYDAAALLRRLIESSRGMTREQLRRLLLDTRDYDGVSGLTGFDARGDSQHRLRLLTVGRSGIHPLGEEP
jgi:ABC-type branched-subunit amino acid transport system substrate-binding protein